MPGGRLNHEDRGQIAAGLAEGLQYAEIARRLDRPTSTISREVLHNGGRHAYRADQAHRATEGRARRRKPVRPPRATSTPDAYGRDREAVRDFERQFTETMSRTGLPPMMARVLSCLMTSDAGELTAAELVQRLEVSPASISKAVGYLGQLGLVRRERDPRRRRERYVIDDDVWYRACAREVQICETWAASAKLGAEVLGAGTPAGTRLRQMGEFFTLVGRDMAQAAEHWRHIFAAQGKSPSG
ncbi:GbsR/MarR family transcriptional regulator [Amycolatopsis nigrescens]|uniref:GbsR/MarR family transcriptional regulator n=1 Tax=Amycolatopsis nigrescens TaxID=381445 RepID=UPI00035D2C28|nr:MarR family transcriptional regulator [Amycolatopsis nigrescens]